MKFVTHSGVYLTNKNLWRSCRFNSLTFAVCHHFECLLCKILPKFHESTTSSFIHLVSATPETIDAGCMPLPAPVKSWVWLVDLERATALLVGRCLGGMLMGASMSKEEREAGGWLYSHICSNGLEATPDYLGM